MPRKYTRYGINRQYRRNPSRKRNPFPYRLPFVPDYRTNPFDSPDAFMSNTSARRNWEKLAKGLLEGAQNRALDRQSRGYLYNRSSQDAHMSDVAQKRKGRSWTANKAGKLVVGKAISYAITGPYLEKNLDRRSYAAIKEGMRVWPAKGPEAAVWAAMRQFVTS